LNILKFWYWKLKNFNREETNCCNGFMMRLDALMGKITVTPPLVTIEYGTGEVAPQSERGHVAAEAGRQANVRSNARIHAPVIESLFDVAPAGYAHTQGHNLYELDDEITQQSFEIIST
jgi:hypothetical protein